METKDEFESKLKEVVCVMPKLSDAIHHLRTEVSEGNCRERTRVYLCMFNS